MKCAILLLFLSYSSAVLYQPPENTFQHSSFAFNGSESVWQDCWQIQSSTQDILSLSQNMGACMKNRMYLGLVSSVDKQCIDIGDGVTFISEGDSALAPRDIFPLGVEPASFRGLADAYSSFLSRRGVKWDLSHLYPGLVMRIGPTLNGDGVLEFVMDRRLDYHDRAKLGPGQQMIRRTILPHLLGFRMNLMSMLPLMFGVLVYVAKNAFLFSKLTLIISSVLALKSLFVLQHLRPPHGVVNDPIDSAVGASEGVSFLGGPRPQPHSLRPDVVLQMFAGALPPFRGVNDKPDDQRFRGNRNFSWQ